MGKKWGKCLIGYYLRLSVGNRRYVLLLITDPIWRRRKGRLAVVKLP